MSDIAIPTDVQEARREYELTISRKLTKSEARAFYAGALWGNVTHARNVAEQVGMTR